MNGPAKKPAMTKESLLPLLAGHVLAQGLGQASLRPLAKAAATSDRMLLYHFGSKDALIADLLGYIARTYAATLDAALAGERPANRSAVVSRILAQAQDPAMQAFTALWWEIVAGAARGEASYRAAAQAMMDELLGWLETQMPADDPDPKGGARYLLTLIEGTLMLGAIGHGDTAQQGLLASGLLPS
jgi:AcrR family transcriptional regulator